MTRRGLLITAEGLDRAGTGRVLDLLARWMERHGRRVEVVQSAPSDNVRRAAASRRSRPFLDARIAALLAAADFERSAGDTVRRGLTRGSIVLADRYVWTAVARDVARGLDPGWARNIYRFAPRPDLSIYIRQASDQALRRMLDEGSANGALSAAAGSLRPFLQQVVGMLDALAATADDPEAEPWPVPATVLDARLPAGSNLEATREAIRPLLASSRGKRPRQRVRDSSPDAVETSDSRGELGLRPPPSDPGRHPLPKPGAGRHREPGRLIVLEGIDHAGRSTHSALLEHYLRYSGRGVVRTSFGASVIPGEVLRQAKLERGWDPRAMVLLYAADLAERMEHVIRPALRAGLVVIADRYAYTPIARAAARGVDPSWLAGLFGFAPPPDLVLLLDVPPATALLRASAAAEATEGAGMDHGQLDEYKRFQELVSRWFLEAAAALGFTTVQADRETASVQRSLRTKVAQLFASTTVALAAP